MNDDEKYLFDLSGYLVLRNVLNPDEVAQMNAAIDHHQNKLKEHERHFEGDSKTLTSGI